MITIPAAGTVGVALAESMVNTNVTVGSDSIIIDVAGNYRVEFFALMQSTTGDFGVDIAVAINGAPIEPSLIVSTVLAETFADITASSIITLAEGDVLTLTLSSLDGGGVLFGPNTHASLSVMRLGN